MVKMEELEQIKEAFKEIKSSYDLTDWDPSVTLVVTVKRHYMRFYPKKSGLQRNNFPGTLVDHTVVAPNQFSFFLQSHSTVIQCGTARPTLYVVIANESGYSAKDLHEIVSHHSCILNVIITDKVTRPTSFASSAPVRSEVSRSVLHLDMLTYSVIACAAICDLLLAVIANLVNTYQRMMPS